MSDWRSNPRQGRSQFLPLLDDIKKRLVLGETQKMIFESYPDLAISYPQFTRYIKKYCTNEVQQVTKEPEPKKIEQTTKTEVSDALSSSRQVARNPADLRRLRNRTIDLEELENSQGNEDESSSS